jgi:rhamnosyltransferase
VQKDAIAENMHSITSGSIIRLSVFQQTGGHDEFLFIDEVDADYSYRLAVLGFKTIRFNGATLQHRLGVLQEARLAGLIKMGKRSFHAPWRNYYMIRNYIIVRHRYKKKLPEIYRKRDRDTLVSVKNNLLLSGRFFPVLYHLIRGFFDGMKYRHKLPVSQLSSSV